MSHSTRLICPSTCPHCAHALPPPAQPRAIQAARALLTLPGLVGAPREIAEVIHVSPSRASHLMREAEGAGLVRRAGKRGRAALWRVEARVVSVYEMGEV